MIKQQSNQQGFTLVELMFATVAFSIVLLGAAAATIQIGRLYYKGVIVARTQETTRRVVDDIARPIQFAGSEPVVISPTVQPSGISAGAVCIGNQRYTYGINVQVDDRAPLNTYTPQHQARHALWQDTLASPASVANCVPLDLTQEKPSDPATTLPGSTGKEVLGQRMRLGRFNVTPPDAINKLWRVDVLVLYGEDDLFEYNPEGLPFQCLNAPQSSKWCAASGLSAQVFKRINQT